MKPNITRSGRIARATSGILCILFGAGVWYFSWPETVLYRWIIGVVAVVAGVFQLFEAKKSWCVMRACGFKTPM